MEKKDLIEYLGFVRQMEEDVYTLDRTKTQLTNKMASLGISQYYNCPHKPKLTDDIFDSFWWTIVGAIVGAILASIIGIKTAIDGGEFKTPFLKTWVICILIGFIIDMFCAAEEQKTYKFNLFYYNRNIAADEARVADEMQEKDFLEQERNKVDSMIDSLKKDLAEAYSCGIIYGTYQNFCAVSSFYEYLASGVCESLDGPDGAMRLYRNEVLQGRIIESLDEIIGSLNEIKMNQATLFDAIERGNIISEKLFDETVRLSQQNDQIIHNTAIDAHNSAVMKNDMNMLTWIAAGNSKW